MVSTAAYQEERQPAISNMVKIWRQGVEKRRKYRISNDGVKESEERKSAKLMKARSSLKHAALMKQAILSAVKARQAACVSAIKRWRQPRRK